MKKFLLVATTTTAIVSFSGAGLAADPYVAPDPSWYITGFGGYSFAEDYDYTFTSAVGADFDYNISHDDGFTVGAAFGHIWSPNFRSELELSYASFDYGSDYVGTTVAFTGLGESGGVDVFMVFANTWLNADLGWVQPYAGGGIGVGFSNGDLSITNGAGDQWSSGETDLALQAGAGLRFPVGTNVEIDASYRLRMVMDVDFESDVAGFSGKGSDITMHTAQLGVTFKF